MNYTGVLMIPHMPRAMTKKKCGYFVACAERSASASMSFWRRLTKRKPNGGNHEMDKPNKLFKAFSDETRLRILNLLAQRDCCVCEFQQLLRVPQPKIS